MRHHLIVILSTFAALAINIALDLSTDLPMLARWAVAVASSLVLVFVLGKVLRRHEPQTADVDGRD